MSIDEQLERKVADEVMEEVWRVKEALAAQYGNDPRRMLDDLRTREESSGLKVVDLSTKRPCA